MKTTWPRSSTPPRKSRGPDPEPGRDGRRQPAPAAANSGIERDVAADPCRRANFSVESISWRNPDAVDSVRSPVRTRRFRRAARQPPAAARPDRGGVSAGGARWCIMTALGRMRDRMRGLRVWHPGQRAPRQRCSQITYFAKVRCKNVHKLSSNNRSGNPAPGSAMVVSHVPAGIFPLKGHSGGPTFRPALNLSPGRRSRARRATSQFPGP